MIPPVVTKSEGVKLQTDVYTYEGDYVVANLKTKIITLKNGTSTIASYPIISQGRPGSYYETIGGIYVNDYKTPLHFSSIGHVYMPYSIHVFGNYFIHGIPYYPDYREVSSTYSGGCIRLATNDAKKVYDFVQRGTPIVITQGDEMTFIPTATSSKHLTDNQMTRLMVATISLEVLTQDNEIMGTDGEMTTRRAILPKLLLKNDETVAELYARSIGKDAFIELMNQKAQALGMGHTNFTDVTGPTKTTYEDYMRFMYYIRAHKRYLLDILGVA
jgi:hypothetical protein